jgi:glycosyltransferase involved in cell wall biosynthesis
VIVPAYNEAENIREVVEKLMELRQSISDLEIVVVDDGSRDDTSKKVAMFSDVKCVRHHMNLGKGAALRSGIEKSVGDVIVIQDADLEYSPNEIPKMVEPILAGSVDIVYGSRLSNGKPSSMSVSHHVGNMILSLATAIMFGVRITDVMTGHKAFTRKVLESFRLEGNGFTVEIELTAKALRNGWRFGEVPVAYQYRQRGFSKIRFMDGFRCLNEILRRKIDSRSWI